MGAVKPHSKKNIERSDLEGSGGFVPNFPLDMLKAKAEIPKILLSPEELIDVSDEIRENGTTEPIIIEKETGSTYSVVAGIKRWKAAQMANATSLPVVIVNDATAKVMEVAAVENVKRGDLSLLEEGYVYKYLADIFSYSHKVISEKVGISRASVTNKIRLLKLPVKVQEMVIKGELTEGHARALLGINNGENIIAAAYQVIQRKMSVRETEELARQFSDNAGSTREDAKKAKELERQIKLAGELGLSMKVEKDSTVTVKLKDIEHAKKLFKTLLKEQK